ncbi:MAG: hypothetical protein R2693_03260 [Nocardioidaceae bacterium]
MDLETFRWLLTESGQQLLAEAGQTSDPEVANCVARTPESKSPQR